MVELKCKLCGGLIKPKTYKIGICDYCESEITFEEEFDKEDLLATEEYRRANCRKFIKSISAYGSNDADETLPVCYSSVFNVNKYDAINFEVEFLEPIQKNGDLSKGFLIYDSDGDVIFEKLSDVYMESGDDTYCVSMYMQYESGGTMPVGEYMALCWIEDSRAERFKFTVVDQKPEPVANTTTTQPQAVEKKGFFKKLFG